MGSDWVHLRMCLTCGHVGCCDQSRWKHATKSNPYGYLYGLTTPEEYVAYKDYYKRFWLRYMLGRTSDASA